MSTVHSPQRSPLTPEPRSKDQLRRDRKTAIVVLAIMAVLMALILWLASLGGGPVEPVDYWQLMP